MVDKETVEWLFFDVAEEHCQWCGRPLVWENHGRKGRGAWEVHHHPGKARMNRAFRGIISPDIPLYLRIISWQCHKRTLGSDFPEFIDYLR